jgi:phage gp36-like protein
MYVERAAVEALIPAPDLIDALDDDRDGNEDDGIFDQVVNLASNAVDAFLAGLFATPFADPAPAVVREAALIFVCEAIYSRRPAGDRNPFKARADGWRQRLKQIGEGAAPLEAGQVRQFTPGAAVTEPASIDGNMR